MMLNHFNLTTHITNLWFLGFNVSTSSGLIAICIGLFAMAFSFEAFTCVRIVFRQRANVNPLKYGEEDRHHLNSHVNEAAPLLNSLTIPVSWELVKKRKICYHILESICFTVQLAIGYMMMLGIMTYNGYLLISVILGAGFGRHLLTAVLPSSTLDIKIHEQEQIDEIIEEYNREVARSHQPVSSNYGAVNT